jgi:ABC-2 type transport system ATP-binding protein
MSTLVFDRLTKRYGTVTALDGFSAEVHPGRITAFLGANGSGKTTSMRLLLGLADPTAGTATVAGRRYRDLDHPLRTVGALVDQGFQPNRTARNHLRVLAAQAGMPRARVDEVLAIVELTDAADRRVGGYSLGMRQRLGLASALVGDPAVLVLDEPFNGLDPNGIQNMRYFLRQFADGGGTVFLSSHLLAEVAHSADDAIIIDHGRLIVSGPVAGLVSGGPAVVVTTTDADLLAVALERQSASVERTAVDRVVVRQASREVIGRAAAELGLVILEMRAQDDDLEAVFQTLIHPQHSPVHRYTTKRTAS